MDAVFPASHFSRPSDPSFYRGFTTTLPSSTVISNFLPSSFERNRDDDDDIDDDVDDDDDENKNENEDEDEASGRIDGRVAETEEE